uniref:Oxaloacetate tautomerase FAHD1, mitochondrial n=1 Tax=Hydra vulgaris TaxID=6087 RepID=T2MB80_HYDVU
MKDLHNFSNFCRKIVCVGRNFVDHALELNNPLPSVPLIFLKPPSSIIKEGSLIKIPPKCNTLHHEVELGVVIAEEGSNITINNAFNYIGGYVLALDMTARDFQEEIKAKSHPWFLAKCWDTFCPISEFIPKSKIVNPENLELWLEVNNCLKQSGNTKNMIFGISQIVSYVSKVTTLEKGDLILMGTPHGVGPVKSGEVIDCGIKNVTKKKFFVE